MKVVIYGGNGMLGPHVVKALEGHVALRLTDLEPFETPHEMMPVDVADPEAVMRAAERDGRDHQPFRPATASKNRVRREYPGMLQRHARGR